ncbi:APC family permease [Cellulomonas oligotrophica]|uniref:APA family basic amino acid/polyamine antiporter n=1 Tax=Cellulomonas oligotrophica TaxID=931536 RepID=A0A7Y9FG53_9CELL|nr:APC family permease [Cellulomonas oligotrophica]NYD86710.1 APA family basic amino acid/polyamine antiporter [Cellulomonas oligotrophica]GIG34575.1 amino acid transporter [Cellulomonas oligotrophica]
MTSPALARRLGLTDAVVVGLSAMLGAGVFAVWAPAAQAAGAGLLVGLVVAAVVAYANATATAQLAAVHPVAGGTYAYGRAELGPWWGFVAGWGFVIGKTASCAAMAMTFAAYAVPEPWQRPAAAAAVVALVAVDLAGVTRTARVARVLVALVLVALAVVVVAGAAGGAWDVGGLAGGAATGGAYGVLQSAGLLFFAFAGYARIATLGEEVVDPARTIPCAITVALGTVMVVYVLLAVTVLGVLGAEGVAASSAPVADAVAATGWTWAGPLVRVGAAAASLGALLALLAGVGRTSLAMAREHDLPGALAAVHPVRQVPHRATLVVGAVVLALVLTVDLRGVIGFSSFGVLVYYAVANLAASRQRGAARRTPRTLQAVGLVGCVVLVVTLPAPSLVVGAAVLVTGVLGRAARLHLAR